MEHALTDQLVDDHTILQVVVGSRAFGLSGAASDTDRRGVYALPASAFWGLRKPARHHDGPLDEQVRWEVERVCTLGLAANPTVLEVLHSPLVETCTPLGVELRALTPAFLSRRVADTYLRYATAQFGKAERGIARAGVPAWRHVMHLIRLLTAGVTWSAPAVWCWTWAPTGTVCWRSRPVRCPGPRSSPGGTGW